MSTKAQLDQVLDKASRAPLLVKGKINGRLRRPPLTRTAAQLKEAQDLTRLIPYPTT